MMLELFWRCILVSLLVFGGRQAVLPLAERIAVHETSWVSSQQVIAAVVSARDDSTDGPRPIPPFQQSPTATDDAKPDSASSRSGLTGTTSARVMSGIPGGQSTGKPQSVAFAIAPIEGEKPVYQKAVFVTSDQHGHYEIALPPGRYWIGPKAQALAPGNYRPGVMVLQEQVAVVQEGVLTHLDLVEVGYAP